METFTAHFACQFESAEELMEVAKLSPRDRTVLMTEETVDLREWYIRAYSVVIQDAAQSPATPVSVERVRVLLNTDTNRAKEVLENLEALGNFVVVTGERRKKFWVLQDSDLQVFPPIDFTE